MAMINFNYSDSHHGKLIFLRMPWLEGITLFRVKYFDTETDAVHPNLSTCQQLKHFALPLLDGNILSRVKPL